MGTTFHIANFKNKTINAITGASTIPSAIGWMNVNNGVQPFDPSVAVPGSSVYSATTSAIPMTASMVASAGGTSSLNGAKSANASSTVSSLTWARIFDISQLPIIDCTVGTAVGGAIISSLSALIGSALTLNQFSLKLPTNNGGTLLLGQALNDRLVDLWTGNSTTGAAMGANGQIDLYTGSAPATADLPPTGTLVASFIGTATNWFNVAANGSGTLISNPAIIANGTGTATYFRWYKTVAGILFTIQGSVGTTATDMVVNTTALVSGVTIVTINELTLSI